jgi:three-Cys-motif partner protein
MSWNKPFEVNEPAADWGGPWTETKLEAFSKYVEAYLKIMKKYNWKTIYFDGFAGSGSRGKSENDELWQQLKITEEEEKVYSGAAERVLRSKHNFDYYYFIDTDQSSLDALKEKLKDKADGKIIEYRPGDVNAQIPMLAGALKKDNYAALVFLDPFGMQIDWTSIAELKGTRSDIWILIPTGVTVNRLLDRAGKLKHYDKLQNFFGLPIDAIKSHFYKESTEQTLFGEEETITKIS